MKGAETIEIPTPPTSIGSSGENQGALRQWLDDAGRFILAKRPWPFRGNVAVKMFAGLSSDPSNAKGLLECIAHPVIALLEEHEIIEQDALSDLTMRWDRTVEGGHVRVEIRSARPPRYRLSAEARARVSQIQRARWAKARRQKQAALAG